MNKRPALTGRFSFCAAIMTELPLDSSRDVAIRAERCEPLAGNAVTRGLIAV